MSLSSARKLIAFSCFYCLFGLHQASGQSIRLSLLDADSVAVVPRRGVALRIEVSGGLDSTARLYVLLSSYNGGFDRPDTIATMGASADTSLVVQVPTLQPYSG